MNAFIVHSVMAKDLLTPRMSIVIVESMFSTSGQVIKKNLNRLALDVVDAVISEDDWYQQEKRLV